MRIRHRWTIMLAASFLFAASAARADEVTLLFSTSNPPSSPITLRVFHPWAERINAQANGTFKIDVRDGLNLTQEGNFYSRLLDNVIQITWGSQSAVPGTFPLSEFLSLPLLTKRSEDASVAFWRLYKTGLLDREFKDIVPLMLMGYPELQLHLVKAPKSIANLNGLRITAPGKTATQVVAALGGAPTSIQLPDIYQALQRGTVDGSVMGWTAFQPFKLAEVTHYHYDAELGGAPAMVFMAKKYYLALPPEAREIINRNSDEAESRTLGQAWDQISEEARKQTMADPQQQVIEPNDEQNALWAKMLAPVTADWAKRTPDGAKVLSAFHAILADVEAGK